MRARRVLVLIYLVVLVAGCSTAVPVGDDGSMATVTVGPDDGRLATVTDVVDGDTVDVRFANGTTDTVRLLGIDSPETHAENTPDEYEGVPDTAAGRECLRAAGQRATEALRSRIGENRIRVVTDPVADRRGSYGRLLAYVYLDGRNLNEWLVARGHARVYDTEFSKRAAFDSAEATAQAERRGLWDCRAGTPTTNPAASR